MPKPPKPKKGKARYKGVPKEQQRAEQTAARNERMQARAEARVAQEHVPTQETRSAVSAMAATFLSQQLISLQLGIDPKTLRKHYQLELDTAIERANATVVARLHSHTTKSPVACFYWLQNRAPDQWQDKRNAGAGAGAGGLSLADLVLASMGKHPLVNGTTAAAPANGNGRPPEPQHVNGAKPNGTNGHG